MRKQYVYNMYFQLCPLSANLKSLTNRPLKIINKFYNVDTRVNLPTRMDNVQLNFIRINVTLYFVCYAQTYYPSVKYDIRYFESISNHFKCIR